MQTLLPTSVLMLNEHETMFDLVTLFYTRNTKRAFQLNQSFENKISIFNSVKFRKIPRETMNNTRRRSAEYFIS